ncbi:MAG: phosphoribosylformylglycinamidine synthase subunit PurL [Acidobacteriota bacterium]
MSDEEWGLALEILGRTPSFTELGIFSVMWSEHCSYKSSRTQLKRLPTTGPQVVHGPGENAGVIDIGDGHVAVFKMESHNHPSQVEPYQGAATGVGGIMRDVFTMGARPIANMDCLRFGRRENPRTRYLVEGVVAGVGGYGNCMGVPTVGGETTFHPSYDGNVLVNAFCLGVAPSSRIFLGTAGSAGNQVFYVGSRTGRDGIHGASLLASAEFDDTTESKRPTVQVGDPFTEKLLLEACLELMEGDAIEGIQDMGAAGLTCSSCEMAGRSGAGMELDLDQVPLREEGMTPYEIMLSESQERMLLTAQPGREDEVVAVFEKWGLPVARVGVVTGDGRLVVKHQGEVVADLPAAELADKAPVFDRPREQPAELESRWELDVEALEQPGDLGATLTDLLASPNLCRASWTWGQYDWSVRTNTLSPPGGDASVIRVKETGKGLAISADCNPRYCFLDPKEGARQAVAEAARNLACVGAKGLAITDCMNFGNPERPDIAWQFAEAITGLSEACIALDTPVVSGNVSFYNETEGKAIHPTPAIVMVGLMDDPTARVPSGFREAGDRVVLLGRDQGELGGSEYLAVVHDRECGRPPRVDLEEEARLGDFLRSQADVGRLRSAHDLSEGGLAVSLAECALHGDDGLGLDVELTGDGFPQRDDVALFSETQARALVSVKADDVADLLVAAGEAGVTAMELGSVGGDRVTIRRDGRSLVDVSLADLRTGWEGSLPNWVEGA